MPPGIGNELYQLDERSGLDPTAGAAGKRLFLWRWVSVLIWSAAVGVSLAWNLNLHHEGIITRARAEAEATLAKDAGIRSFIASLGGVYARTDRGVQPSDDLATLPERDIVTADSTLLTLVNPSYFLRLLHDHERDRFQSRIRGHAAGLKPLGDTNQPDTWERHALLSFEQGAREVAEVVREDGKTLFRLMRPSYAMPACLDCHDNLAYQVGDVLGGVSVSVPVTKAGGGQTENPRLFALSAGHAVLWFLGVGGLVAGFGLLERRERALQRSAFYDPLTDLPNRTLLQDRLQQALVSAQRLDSMSAVLFIDLDRFKIINDSLGHAVGDGLLKEVARRLKDSVRGMDTVARQGGDEFVVLLAELQNDPERAAVIAQSVAEKVLRSLKQPVRIGNHELHVSPSVGIALFPMGADKAEEILKQADAAMYQAKGEGGGAFHFYLPSMQLAAAGRLELEIDLRHAINRSELELHYQPQIAVDSGRLVGAEALLRWNHTEKGMVTPSDFIPIAEETGIILAIGERVLEEACRCIRDWCDRGLVENDFRLAINVSPKQFRQWNFVEIVARIIADSGIDARHLELEVTEGMFVDDVQDAAFKMECLMELGIRFAIDDFGTGYSSLMYLKRLPLDVLKIDQSFIDGVIDNPNDAAIVETILAMAEKLDYHVVAEGVENAEQLAFLNVRGCQSYQGYLFSRPLEAREFEKLFKPAKGTDH